MSDGTYPEHDKQSAVLDDAQIIGDFLTWLEPAGFFVAEWVTTIEEHCRNRYVETYRVTKCEEGRWIRHLDKGAKVDLGLCKECEGTGFVTRDRVDPIGLPTNMNIEGLLARYFSIDQKKIEAEKRAMLAVLRAAS